MARFHVSPSTRFAYRGSPLAAFLFLALVAAFLRPSSARVNATGAIAVFLINKCEDCVSDKNSGFCSQAGAGSNFVANSTTKVTINDKKIEEKWGKQGTDGNKYCWEGTFGALKNTNVKAMTMLGENNVTAFLECAQDNIYYRQCFIAAQTAIILMAIGSIAFVGGLTLFLLCCGFCKCCNEPGDTSKYGLCNRFCPWCYICADKHLKVTEDVIEISEDRSLTGKNSKLNEAYGKVLTEKQMEESGGLSSLSQKNPLFSAAPSGTSGRGL